MKYNKLIPYAIIALTTSISYFNDSRRMSLLLVALMVLSPLIIVKMGNITKKGIFLLFFGATIFLCPLSFNPESFRISTVLYSLLYILFFIAYEAIMLHDGISIQTYKNTLRSLILAYFITLLIQQFCVLFGLPIFAVSNHSIAEKWKLNSLASEPSHAMMSISILMFSYMRIYLATRQQRPTLRDVFIENKWIWIAFLWCIITSLSASAYVFLLIVLSLFVNKKSILLICTFFVVICTCGYYCEFKPVVRFVNLSLATLTLDTNQMIQADHSGSLRIVPAIVSLQEIDLTTLSGWFGKGIDYGTTIMSEKVPGLYKGASGGGLFLFLMEYGAIPFLLFCFFSLKVCIDKNAKIPTLLLWVLMIGLTGINNQSAWTCIILLYTNKYLINQAQNDY